MPPAVPDSPARAAVRLPAVLTLALALIAALAGPAGAAAVTPPPGGSVRPTSAWAWPLDGPHAVSRPFAPGTTPYAAGHRGADLPAVPGAVVRAAGAGRVAYAGLLAGRGVVVVVHGALRTTYEPVTSTVPVGATVVAGAPVGTLDPGHAGCPAPACLHWGLLRGQAYLDPVRLGRPVAVRLLPRLPAGTSPGAALAPAAGASPWRATAVSAPAPVRDLAARSVSYHGSHGTGWPGIVAVVVVMALFFLLALLVLLEERRSRRTSAGRPGRAAARAPRRRRAWRPR